MNAMDPLSRNVPVSARAHTHTHIYATLTQVCKDFQGVYGWSSLEISIVSERPAPSPPIFKGAWTLQGSILEKYVPGVS